MCDAGISSYSTAAFSLGIVSFVGIVLVPPVDCILMMKVNLKASHINGEVLLRNRWSLQDLSRGLVCSSISLQA